MDRVTIKPHAVKHSFVSSISCLLGIWESWVWFTQSSYSLNICLSFGQMHPFTWVMKSEQWKLSYSFVQRAHPALSSEPYSNALPESCQALCTKYRCKGSAIKQLWTWGGSKHTIAHLYAILPLSTSPSNPVIHWQPSVHFNSKILAPNTKQFIVWIPVWAY